jgi:hypothetical protein
MTEMKSFWALPLPRTVRETHWYKIKAHSLSLRLILQELYSPRSSSTLPTMGSPIHLRSWLWPGTPRILTLMGQLIMVALSAMTSMSSISQISVTTSQRRWHRCLLGLPFVSSLAQPWTRFLGQTLHLRKVATYLSGMASLFQAKSILSYLNLLRMELWIAIAA